MLNILKRLFGSGSGTSPDFTELLKNDGIIIDVRTSGEYASGHIKGSKNIPLNTLSGNLSKLKNKERPIITCCASGMRSATAKNILKNQGFTNVHNGGGWKRLNQKIS
ncbi:Rhodanese-related sulfurtransferase [Zhouia amylolytica]|uniref:Rhodanese-related sulfurtransferase n=1 Tax=Zhouia amylolytica TaxID=376730 RepID=A0A1I6T366_9FLAO|nr:rhodanese-like domain-containing protein [Zhouia amylolytica]SFS83478.1 Rhodanese-related sulfurtransferase [Zhouia amylolytica]